MSSCKSAYFLCLIYLFFCKKASQRPLYSDFEPSVFPHAVQNAQAPSSCYIPAVIAKLSGKSPQQESPGTGKWGMAYQPPSIELDEQEAMTR